MNKYFEKLILAILLATQVAFCSPTKDPFTVDDQLDAALRHVFSDRKDFDAPMDLVWKDFFDQGLGRVDARIARSSLLKVEDVQNFNDMLSFVRAKGNALFDANEMNTHWYLFLHLVMSNVISMVQDIEKDGDLMRPNRSQMEGPGLLSPGNFVLRYTSSLDGGFNKGSPCLNIEQLSFVTEMSENYIRLVRDHKPTLQNDLRIWLVKQQAPLGDYVGPDGKTYDGGTLIRMPGLEQDSFFLPLVGSPHEVELTLAQLNKAQAHRISCVGIPTELADFDGTVGAHSFNFVNHDLDHAGFMKFCVQTDQCVVRFTADSQVDPLLAILHPLWTAMQTLPYEHKSRMETAFFLAVHESSWYALQPFITYSAPHLKDNLNDAPAVQKNLIFKNDFASYIRAELSKSGSVEGLTFISCDEAGNARFSVNDKMVRILRSKNGYLNCFRFDPYSLPVGYVWPSAVLTTNIKGHLETYNTARRELFNSYNILCAGGFELPDALKAPEGIVYTVDTFDGEATQHFINAVLFPEFMALKEEVIGK